MYFVILCLSAFSTISFLLVRSYFFNVTFFSKARGDDVCLPRTRHDPIFLFFVQANSRLGPARLGLQRLSEEGMWKLIKKVM